MFQAIKPSSPLRCSQNKVLAFQEEEEQRVVAGPAQRTGRGRSFWAVEQAGIHQTAPRYVPFSCDPAVFPQQKIPGADHQLCTDMKSRTGVMPGAQYLQCCIIFCFTLGSVGFCLSGDLPGNLYRGVSVWLPPHS